MDTQNVRLAILKPKPLLQGLKEGGTFSEVNRELMINAEGPS